MDVGRGRKAPPWLGPKGAPVTVGGFYLTREESVGGRPGQAGPWVLSTGLAAGTQPGWALERLWLWGAEMLGPLGGMQEKSSGVPRVPRP